MEKPNLEGSEFLVEKYRNGEKPLHTSQPVKRAFDIFKSETLQNVPNNPSAKISAYLKRLEHLILDPENNQDKKDLGDVLHTKRPRALALLRKMIIREYITPNKDKMAEGAAAVEERAARQMGHDVQYNEAQLNERGNIAVGDLESSLDQWITYLSNPNEPYPTWFRYYVFRNILNLGEFDKDKQEFPNRSKGTFKLFPEIDRGALAYIQEMIEASKDETVLNRIRESQKTLWNTPENELMTKNKATDFANLSFAKQYAEGLKQNGEISPELRAETRGEWIHYTQGSDPTELWKSLQNKGTAWCTKGYPTAETQLKGGDFYVYYTLDATGAPKIPRIAIRMEGQSKIAEPPRGVYDTQQNLEANMLPILDEKLLEFGPEADKFKKRSADMKMLTEIEAKCFRIDKKTKEKTNLNPQLTKAELQFIYELNSTIESFGYNRDPRIDEIRKTRNVNEDLPIIFECTLEQIATTPSEVNEHTTAYIGPWNPTIFNQIKPNLSHITYLYESFPDVPIFYKNLETDPTLTREIAAEKISQSPFYLSDYGKDVLSKTEFSKIKETHQLVSFSVAQLGFSNGATTDQIYAKAESIGLELCPAEIGPQLRLQYTNQSKNQWLLVAMKQILGRGGSPSVFDLDHGSGGLGLDGGSAGSDDGWDPGRRFVFRVASARK